MAVESAEALDGNHANEAICFPFEPLLNEVFGDGAGGETSTNLGLCWI